MSDEIDFGALSSVKKVSGLIPIRLYEELQRKGLFAADWDMWLARAILEKLREDEREASH